MKNYINLSLLDFSIKSLLRYRSKNIFTIIVLSFLIALIYSMLLITNSLKTELNNTYQALPEIIVQKSIGGKRLRIFSDKLSRSYLRVYFGKEVNLILKSQIRRFFGHKKLPSTRFLFKRTGRFYTIAGYGRGHGVGMSQIGALYMAKDGMNYRQILAHYYPGFRIKKIY